MSCIEPTVSVVIIGRNEGDRLQRCLQSVTAMEAVPGGQEVLYVDSGSTDRSIELAVSFGARALRLDTERPSAARARNAGWRAARGRWILFLDGDTILHPAFTRTALRFADVNSIAAVWGHRREIHPEASIFQRVLDLDWVYPAGDSDFCGGDVLMRREALESVNGFDDTLIAGEEPELCARLRAGGYRILHIDAPMTGHDLAITRWHQYWKRASRAGYAYSQVAWRTRNGRMRLWAEESAANRKRAAILLASVPLLLLCFLCAPWLAAAGATAALMLVLRSAWRARWKSGNPVSLLLYAVHSHVQQIPIFAGQLAFRRDLAHHRQRGLIEYK